MSTCGETTVSTIIGVELVPGTRRLTLMTCLLHGMQADDEGVVYLGNALGHRGQGLDRADIILANPPFYTAKGGEASITCEDLTYPTIKKQLVFLRLERSTTVLRHNKATPLEPGKSRLRTCHLSERR